MCKVEHRGKIAYIWISPHLAKSETLLEIVVVVVVIAWGQKCFGHREV